MKKLCSALLVPVLALTAACKSDAAVDAPTPTAEGVQEAPPTGTEEATDDAPVAAEAPGKVEIAVFDLKEFPGEAPTGESLGGFAFVDAAGKNFVAFSREALDAGDEPGAVLHIEHVAQKEGGELRKVRSYVEKIASCDADIILEPRFGDWSVSDIDADGIGEASFAYTASCTSDISPNPHKAFITEGGEKYVLRGNTSVKPGPGAEVIGGEYEADEMPPAFLKKATAVWDDTSKGFGLQ